MSGVGSNSYTHHYYVTLYITSPAGTGGTNDGSTEESFPASAAASVGRISILYLSVTPPVCPSTILYTRSVTPSLSNNPSYRTGMGHSCCYDGKRWKRGRRNLGGGQLAVYLRTQLPD